MYPKMKYATTALSKLFEHRYKIEVKIFNISKNVFRDVSVFLDTGCFNTMIPRYLAEHCGCSLGFKMKYSLGGNIIEAEAFSINKIMIGDFMLERVIAFAGEYKGNYEDDIILGTNVMNNWEMIISKKSHSFQFREDTPENLPNKTNIYQNFFNRKGEYICVQDS